MPTMIPNRAICSARYETSGAVASALSVAYVFLGALGTGFPSSSISAAAGLLVPLGFSGSSFTRKRPICAYVSPPEGSRAWMRDVRLAPYLPVW